MSEDTEFIIIIRPEFMRICKDACRAAALNHLLFRIAYKCKDQPKEKIQSGEITWYATTEQITREMSHAWGECKVRKEVNALISTDLVKRQSNPQWGADRTKYFSFGKEQCHKFLELCQEQNICVVHLDLPVEVKHLIYISNANDTSIKCICSIHQMEAIDVSDANDRCIEAIPKKTTKIDYKDNSKEESDTDASAIAPAAPTPFVSQAEPIRIATDAQDREKAGQDNGNITTHRSSDHRDRAGRTDEHVPQTQEALTPKASVPEIEDVPPDENNSHSHSDVTQANSVGVVPHGRAKAVPPDEQKTPPKPQRKPKVLKDAPTPEQIEQVIVCMEQTIKRLAKQDDFSFSRSKNAKSAVKDLLTGPAGTVRRITREKLEWEITKLYHRPKDPKTGFLWADNLSVPAICNNYDKETVDYRPGGIAQQLRPQPHMPKRMPTREEMKKEPV